MCSSRRQHFVSGSCGGRTLAFSFIVLVVTKLHKLPMYSCRHILTFFMFRVRPKVALCAMWLCIVQEVYSDFAQRSSPHQVGLAHVVVPNLKSQAWCHRTTQKHHSLQFIFNPFSSLTIHWKWMILTYCWKAHHPRANKIHKHRKNCKCCPVSQSIVR